MRRGGCIPVTLAEVLDVSKGCGRGRTYKWVRIDDYYVPVARGEGCDPGGGGPGMVDLQKRIPPMLRETYDVRVPASASQRAYGWEAGTCLQHSIIPHKSAGHSSASIGGYRDLSLVQ